MLSAGRRLAAGAAALWLATAATGAERVVEDFARGRRFAARDAAVAVEPGGRDGHAWIALAGLPAGRDVLVANPEPYRPAIDARGRFVKVWVWVDDASALAGMEFRLGSGDGHFAFTLRRYGDPEYDLLVDREWTTLTFGFGDAQVVGAPDRAAIDTLGWYVAAGADARVNVRWGGLALVDAPGAGVVSLTFDDGYDEHHAAARRMAEYGFAGTAYVIPHAIGRAGYMSARQVVDLQERYGWDVAAHHETPFTQLAPGRLEETILGVRRSLVQRFRARADAHLAYPLGKQSDPRVRAQARKHFRSARTAALGPETLPPADWHLLRVFNVVDTTTPEEVGAAARRAREHGEWLILMFHYLVAEPRTPLEYGAAAFDDVLRALRDSGVRVLPLSQVWSACHAPGDGCALDALASPAR